jgi:hypothetical protein
MRSFHSCLAPPLLLFLLHPPGYDYHGYSKDGYDKYGE